MEENRLLKILIISDIHLSVKSIINLKNKIKNKIYDKIIIPGDFCKYTEKESADPKNEKDCYKKVLNLIKTINTPKLVEPENIYFLPGNHDHISMFSPNYKLENYTNIEKNFIKFEKNLIITGLGGSIPGYNAETKKKEFNGFPYINDEDFKTKNKNYKKYFEKKIKELDSKTKILFITHSPPALSSTGILQSEGYDIKTGSFFIDEFLKEFKENILVCCHGHCHDGVGVVNYYGSKIINPGSLSCYSSFCEVFLVEKGNGWEVENVFFYYLDFKM